MTTKKFRMKTRPVKPDRGTITICSDAVDHNGTMVLEFILRDLQQKVEAAGHIFVPDFNKIYINLDSTYDDSTVYLSVDVPKTDAQYAEILRRYLKALAAYEAWEVANKEAIEEWKAAKEAREKARQLKVNPRRDSRFPIRDAEVDVSAYAHLLSDEDKKVLGV